MQTQTFQADPHILQADYQVNVVLMTNLMLVRETIDDSAVNGAEVSRKNTHKLSILPFSGLLVLPTNRK